MQQQQKQQQQQQQQQVVHARTLDALGPSWSQLLDNQGLIKPALFRAFARSKD
jgi:hypothetical protein